MDDLYGKSIQCSGFYYTFDELSWVEDAKAFALADLA